MQQKKSAICEKTSIHSMVSYIHKSQNSLSPILSTSLGAMYLLCRLHWHFHSYFRANSDKCCLSVDLSRKFLKKYMRKDARQNNCQGSGFQNLQAVLKMHLVTLLVLSFYQLSGCIQYEFETHFNSINCFV